MLDDRRKRYLAAMGLQVYVRRDRTVAASPSAPPGRTDGDVTGIGGEARRPAATIAGKAPCKQTPASRDAAHTRQGGGPAAEAEWDALRREVAACTACPLHESRTRTVFGVGNPAADLMVIGEAPGADEDRQGEPFVGRAGQLLTAMLRAIGLKRGDVYIANILKCRPPGNRNPSPAEVACCLGYLERQIALVVPRLIVAVGAVSAHTLLRTEESVGRLRGRVHEFGNAGTPLLVSYHPAYLLRQPADKAKAWQDLQKIKCMLEQQ